MQCPECKSEISDKEPKCSACGFDVSTIAKLLEIRPVATGLLNDFAAVLSPKEAERLENLLEETKKSTGRELVVVTVKSTRPLSPAQYIFWLFNEWGVGGNKHHGVMILLALEERRIETEVGWNLESIITDKKSGEILDRAVVDHLKQGHYGAGLLAGAEAIIAALGKR